MSDEHKGGKPIHDSKHSGSKKWIQSREMKKYKRKIAQKSKRRNRKRKI